jgi:hypothetical protein
VVGGMSLVTGGSSPRRPSRSCVTNLRCESRRFLPPPPLLLALFQPPNPTTPPASSDNGRVCEYVFWHHTQLIWLIKVSSVS